MNNRLQIFCFVALVGAFAFYGSGCKSVSPVHIPDDKLAACQDVSPETADSHWVVLKWFVEEYSHPDKSPIAVSAAEDGLAKAETVVRLNWRQDKTQRFDFLTAKGSGLLATDVTTASPLSLREAIRDLEAGILLKPELETATSFYWIDGLAASPGFADFLQQTHRLKLPPTADEAVIAALRRGLMQKSAAAIDRIRKLVKTKKYRQAYQSLDQQVKVYRKTPAEKDIVELQDKVASLLLLAEIAKLRAGGYETAETNEATRKKLYAARGDWLDDATLRAAFHDQRVQKAFEKLQMDIGDARGRLWQEQMKTRAEKSHYWRLFLFHKECLKEAAEMEKPVQNAAAENAWTQFLALIPSAYGHFLKQAAQEIQKGERHGTAIVLYDMMDEMAQFVAANKRELSDDAKQLLKNAERRAAQSQKFVKLYVKRKLFIEDIMPKGGLGTELRGELEAEFNRLCKESPMLYGVEFGEEERKSTPKDYLLTKGIYATLDAVYGKDFVVQKNLTLKGEVIEKDNPAYRDAVAKERDTSGIPPKLYEQAYYKFTINRKTSEAVATARLGFTLEHGGGKDIHKINLKQSLRRSFVRETIDPNETERTTEPIDAPPAKPGKKNPQPELKRERVLTILEMKEWARGEIRKITVMRLLAALAAYPLEIAAQAEEAEDEESWQMATNFLGMALAYCKNIEPAEASKSEYFFASSPPAYLKDEYARNAKLVKTIAALKKELWPRCKQAFLNDHESE